jgi:hypothetical protein
MSSAAVGGDQEEDNRKMSQPSGQISKPEGTDRPANPDGEWINRRATEQATRAANARQLSGRRRFVDPTTCEREYSEAEMEFMMAMNDYKHRSGRMFPTWSEVLEVLRALGYEKIEGLSPERGGIERKTPASLAAR